MTNEKMIVIDPGHGMGSDGRYKRPIMDCSGPKAKVVRGAHNDRSMDDLGYLCYREDHGTLKIANEAYNTLGTLGYHVQFTRFDYEDVAQNYPNAKIPKWKIVRHLTELYGADAFVALHTNAGGGSGPRVFCRQPKAPGILDSSPLARCIMQSIVSAFDFKTGKVKRKNYAVLNSKIPSALVECCFHDNIDDMQNLLGSDGFEKMGMAVAHGIDRWFRRAS